MGAVVDRLASLQVTDVMNRDIVPIYTHQTMAQAAAVFVEHAISGAPVLDEQGHCVGILTASDFVQHERIAASMSSSLSACEKAIVRDRPDGMWCFEDVYQDRVVAHMSRALQTLDAHTPVAEAARIMCAQHIHRLPVLDRHGHPLGMVTSLDIAAALVQAVDEAAEGTGRVAEHGPEGPSYSENTAGCASGCRPRAK